MPRVAPTAGFEKYLSELLSKREEYQQGLSEIDALFGKWGITVETPAAVKRGPGRPKASPAPAAAAPAAPDAGRKQKKRGTFAQTAEQFIVGLLKNGKGLATADINKAWKKEGRGGRADQMLAKMVNAKKLKRTSVPGLRGSLYVVV
jgi:hypothetical protein